MVKRKREIADQAGPKQAVKSRTANAGESAPSKKAETITKAAVSGAADGKKSQDVSAGPASWDAETTTIQIVTGSYERVLHGLTAAIPRTLVTGSSTDSKDTEESKVEFSDTFLFNAHGSAIRCLAVSPPTEDPNGRVLLATGSTDERINVYSISLCPPAVSKNTPKLPSLSGNTIAENAKNKELGSLMHHSSSISALYFPTRSKLLSSSEDSTIAITRTRDWEPLSTIKAPIPKPQGRPSGDTAGPGEVPSGVTDFAVHPSNKLMLSVSKGEKCMRLWNLVTGKKAGVLTFNREILQAAGEGRFSTGEGRRVVWDAEGEEFAVAFERGVLVFGIDCKVKAHIIPTPRTKIHQMQYLPSRSSNGDAKTPTILAIATEDGRIMFYNTDLVDTAKASKEDKAESDSKPATLIAQVGGPAAGITGRVKDFQILLIPEGYLIVAGSSDGSLRVWNVTTAELSAPPSKTEETEKPGSGFTAKQVGKLIATHATNSRITCLKAFVMTGKIEEAVDEEEWEGAKTESESESSDEE